MDYTISHPDNKSGYIFDIKKFAVHDGPGIRTTVFLKGCPAQCWWCHNPESQQMRPQPFMRKHSLDGMVFEEEEQAGQLIPVEKIMREILKERVYMDQSGGGVTFSGGEPFMQPEFLADLISCCKEEHIHIAVDTTGYVETQILNKMIDSIDLFLYDLKIMDPKTHIYYTGISNNLILKNLQTVFENGRRIRIRFPVIPGVTDEEENLGQIHSYLAANAAHIERLDMLAFHNIAREKYHRFGREFKMDKIKEPSDEYMEILRERFRSLDIPVSIGG